MSTLLEDKNAIRELTADYCFHIDNARFGPWLDLWTDDAVFEVDGKVVRGRAELEQFTGTIRLVDGKPPVKHCVMNQIIDVQGDRATAKAYLLTVVKRKDGSVITATAGVYSDKLVRTRAGWRFSERRLSGDLRWEAPK
jgi:ketosteroid isomerase-like protein